MTSIDQKHGGLIPSDHADAEAFSAESEKQKEIAEKLKASGMELDPQGGKWTEIAQAHEQAATAAEHHAEAATQAA